MNCCFPRTLISTGRNIRKNVRILCTKPLMNTDGSDANQINFYPLDHKPKYNKHIKGEILFGIHPVKLALEQNKRKIHKLLVKEGISNRQVQNILRLAKEMSIKKVWVKKSTLESLSGKRPHQGVCLDVDPLSIPEMKNCSIDFSDTCNKVSLWVLLYQILDPMNVGAVIRTSYYLGVDKIITLDKKSGALNPIVSKASSGAMEAMEINVCPERKLSSLFEEWKKKGGIVVGCGGDSNDETISSKTLPLSQFKPNGKPVLLIAGNEMKGIPNSVLSHTDNIVTIEPSASTVQSVDSLNVSVATGITLHYILSQLKTIK